MSVYIVQKITSQLIFQKLHSKIGKLLSQNVDPEMYLHAQVIKATFNTR